MIVQGNANDTWPVGRQGHAALFSQVSEKDVWEHFSRWGEVLDVYFPGKHRGQRASYCFVTFAAEEESQAACAESERNIQGHVRA